MLRDRIRRARLFAVDASALPNVLQVVLPADGEYLVTVAQPPSRRHHWWRRHSRRHEKSRAFSGDYCILVRSDHGAAGTLAPTRWVESP